MERNYLRRDSLIEMDFTTDHNLSRHSHEDIEMLFLVSGKMVLTVGEDVFQLAPGDMVVINENRSHSYRSSKDALAARFLISAPKVQELLGEKFVLFWCNSTKGKGEAYGQLRRVIVQILNQSVRQNTRSRLFIQSKYFQLLHILSENFLLTQSNGPEDLPRESKEEERIREILSYLRANYSQNISLEDLANHLYLSPTYVSKYIRQKCGVNFTELLNRIRFNHAMDDLVYTDAPILKIALDNGFASAAAYNKVFKEIHGMTSSQFRKNRKPEAGEGDISGKENRFIEEKVEEYILSDPENLKEEDTGADVPVTIDLNREDVACNDGACNKLINAGSAIDLLNSDVQEQILAGKSHLGFVYVRFWDIFSPDMYLNIHLPHEEQNYMRLNRVTDFLVKNGLIPYIELGFKPVRILRSANVAVRDVDREEDFHSPEEMEGFFGGLMRNFIARYGTEEVKKWYFEYWENTNIHFNREKAAEHLMMAEEWHRDYFRRFTVVAGALRRYLPMAKVGGGGFPIRFYGENWFAQMLTIWKQEKELPDFITLSCYPYVRETENGVTYEKRGSDLEFVSHNLDMALRAMEMADFPGVGLHVSEYSFSLSNRCVLNDSPMKAAWMVYNAISCMGKAGLLGHWLYTDVYSEAEDSGTVLFGGCGMLTRNGITKPSYYALEFLNRLYGRVACRSSNCLATRNDRGSVRLIVHNMKKLNFNFYLSDEDEIETSQLAGMYEDNFYQTFHVTINGLREGVYYIKQNRMGRSHGSVQDLWSRLNRVSHLTMHEMDFLARSSTSAISIKEEHTDGTSLRFDLSLEPNEIQYVHIHPK